MYNHATTTQVRVVHIPYTSCSGSDTCGARMCIYNTHGHKFINDASVNIIMILATFPPVNQSTHHFMCSCTVDCLHGWIAMRSPPLVTWKTFITPAHSISETNKQKQLFIHVLTTSCLTIMHCKSTQWYVNVLAPTPTHSIRIIHVLTTSLISLHAQYTGLN